MPYQSFFGGAQASAAPKAGGGGYQSFFGTPTIVGPNQAQLSQQRLSSSLQNIHTLKPNDQVRLINQGIKAGLVDPNKGSQAVTQILGGVKTPGLQLNPLEKAVNFGVGAARFPVQQAASFAKTVLPTHSSAPAQLLQSIQRLPVNQRTNALNSGARTVLQNAGFNVKDLSDNNINAFIKKDIGVAKKASSYTPNNPIARVALGDTPVQSVPARVAGSTQALQSGVHIPIINKTVHATGSLGATLARIGVGANIVGGIAPTESGKFVSSLAENAVKGGAKVAGKELTPEALKSLQPVLHPVKTGAGKVGQGISKAGVAVSDKIAPVTNWFGSDKAANDLISRTRATQGLQTAGRANALGSGVVKEANTTHIPVTEPAPPTAIPVAGKSTQVTGKASTVSAADYTKQSQQLSKAYDKETAALQNLPPVAQKVMQTHIDAKYQALQQKLDESAGKTSVSFTGRQTAAPLPRSALDNHEPIASPTQPKGQSVTPLASVETPKTSGQGSVKSIPVTTPVKSEIKSTTSTGGAGSVSGSALRTEQKAVESGMQGELAGKAEYGTVSHKAEAADAVKLVHENPQQAMDIAMGRRAGNNASHEAAVYHAVANNALQEAKRTGDYSTVTQLASSPRHTGVSEAAQKLGAEGYNVNPHDPVQIMADVAKTRQAALGSKAGKTVEKEAAAVKTEVKQAMPKVSRQDWHNFVESLKC